MIRDDLSDKLIYLTRGPYTAAAKVFSAILNVALIKQRYEESQELMKYE